MDYNDLFLEIDGNVAVITLNRPEKLNALSRGLQQEMLAACAQLRNDDTVRAVIWTGAGRGFCSGADLTGPRPEGAPEPTWQESLDEDGWVGRQAKAAYLIGKPTIAAVNGVAAGAGMSLSLACDFRIGSDTARFKTVFVERALSPDAGMSYFLPRIVGIGRAMELVLTSRAVGADEALAMGLLNKVVPAADLLTEAKALANMIAAHPPLAVQMAKRALQHSLDSDFENQLHYETRAIQLAGAAKNDRMESALSFREKRPGKYTGH